LARNLICGMVPDTSTAMDAWRAWIQYERRYSPHTLASYERAVASFLRFIADRIEREPSLTDLGELTPADLRAYLAARSNSCGASSRAHTVSVLRNLFRFLDRRGLVSNAAVSAL